MKRAYKLQEIAAHTSNVNCLKIGRKSAGVLVTGGEDKKVNVWAIGKPTAVLSMSGHQSPVECVSFDSAEEVVVAGATGGTVKLWDLEQAKVIRTLTGHRSSCLSVDFHPFGDFFASGSLDTSLKVWDVRRKACINTYKGHTRGVTNIQFSPDGRLLASGGQDGDLKVWDLTAGKLLHDFCHEEAITGLEFHPSEFVLATSSADRTVKWWDLETSELIDTAGPEMTGVKSIAFPANGDCLLAAMQDGLRVWAYEPIRRHDTVDIPWAKVRDMSLNEQDGKLVACSCNNSFVGIWVVDLNKIKPFSGPAVRKAPTGQGPDGHNLMQSLSLNAAAAAVLSPVGRPSLVPQPQQPLLPISGSGPLAMGSLTLEASALSPALIRSTKAPMLPISCPLTGSQTALPANDPQGYSASYRVDSSLVAEGAVLCEQDCLLRSMQSRSQGVPSCSQQVLPMSLDALSRLDSNSAHPRGSSTPAAAALEETPDRPPPSPATPLLQHGISAAAAAPESAVDGARQSSSEAASNSALLANDHVPPAAGIDSLRHNNADVYAVPVALAADIDAQPDTRGSFSTGMTDQQSRTTEMSLKSRSRVPQICGELRGRVELSPGPSGLDMDAFLPPSLSPRQGQNTHVPDTEVMAELMAKHQTMMSILSSRQGTLQIVGSFWARGDVRGALAALLQSSDASVIMDVLSMTHNSPQLLKLDYCSQIVACLHFLLVSAHEMYVQTAVETAHVLLRTFGQVIQQTCQPGVTSVGVDLSFEDRRNKCDSVRSSLKQLCLPLQSLIHTPNPCQATASRLMDMLTRL